MTKEQQELLLALVDAILDPTNFDRAALEDLRDAARLGYLGKEA